MEPISSESWVDSHGHLFLVEEESEAVIKRAVAAGVEWLMCPGVDVRTSERSREIAEQFPERVLWRGCLAREFVCSQHPAARA